jgi:predicted nucleotidyltransferase
MRTAAPLLLPIFRSAAQAHVLAAVFLAPEPLTIQAIADRANVTYSTAHREIGRLLAAGLFSENRTGNYRLIEADVTAPTYVNLHGLLETAFGAVPVLERLLQGIDGVAAVAVFGSYAERALQIPGSAPGDIDVLVVGDGLDINQIHRACSEAASLLHREVNPLILSVDEWKASSTFLDQIREGSLLPVIGDLPK